MKGFVRILEALISSIILFTSLSYFFTAYDYSFWNAAPLRTLMQDAVYSLYAGRAVNDSFYSGDPAPLKDALEAMMPPTTDFSAEITGAPPPEIKIHCVCAIPEADAVRSRLGLANTLFEYDRRTISIIMSADLDINKADKAADIILFLRTSDLARQEQRLSAWLGQGRNVMLLADLRQTDFTNSDVAPSLINVFGLAWIGGSPGTSKGTFTQADDVKKIPYKIAKYFIGSSTYTASEDFGFNSGPSVNRITPGEGTIINSRAGATDFSFVMVREATGRALWFADYDAAASVTNPDGSVTLVNDDTNKLLRAAIVWESGEKYVIAERQLPSKQPYMRYDFPGAIDSDPYKITILIWKAFY